MARDVLSDVAAAVGLREGRSGVEEVLRHLATREVAATRDLSRLTGLPVPLVAAVCGELRRAGLLTAGRPARLTRLGRECSDSLGGDRPPDPCRCDACGGTGVVLPAAYAALAGRLEALLEGVPAVDRALDQAHCTVETKLRRVAYLWDAGALSGRSVLLLGDDDQVAIAIGLAATALGLRPPSRLVVLDVDPAVVAFAGAGLERLGATAELVVHDVRRPLPERLRSGFDAVLTDPPYTPAGAELFLSRAAAALRPEPGRQAFLCLGARPPDEGVAVQGAIAGMGFAIHRLVRNFNEYVGAGALGGASHLYHLVTGGRLAASVAGDYDAPLYTGEVRRVARPYACGACGARLAVGPRERWPTVEDLRRAGCPRCAGTVFRPGRRGRP
ncbi:MAG TPA: bis-aminopropyl spermidine synthase family protein [Candidatus Dormibacteraeota bacterium]|nr:bis-aminopropyl spermidine synthase family protein [Candidatus Dormibacteraeota bacterium]